MPISKNDLKNYSALKRKTNREQNQSFIVEGKKSCLELLKSKFKIVATFVTDEKLITEFPNATIISEKELNIVKILTITSSCPSLLRRMVDFYVGKCSRRSRQPAVPPPGLRGMCS